MVGGAYTKDTPEAIAERKRHSAACGRAVKEREQRFPVLTPENAAEAIAWQEARIRELTGKTGETTAMEPIYSMTVDHPRVRASRVCPLCGGGKAPGLVCCWTCYQAQGLRYGSERAEARIETVEQALTVKAEG